MELGLTSVTFRNLTYQEILHYCQECGLTCIEWGSDIHVPQTDFLHAEIVREASRSSGIQISSYGSYYSLCTHENWREAFLPFLKTAVALNAPVIRIWSGSKCASEASREYYCRAVRETQELCDMASDYHIAIAFEYHDGTLSDTGDNALKIAEEIGRKNFGLYFQYDSHVTFDENINSLNKMLPFLKMIHVAYNDVERNALFLDEGEGIELWTRIVRALRRDQSEVCLLFEFLKETSMAGLMRQTQTMRKLLKEGDCNDESCSGGNRDHRYVPFGSN